MHPYHKEYDDQFQTFKSIKVPDPVYTFSRLIKVFFVFLILFLVFTPWIQTSTGRGTITALSPDDRLQTINALVSGRIGKWYVREGQRVKAGDPIVEIIDNDPDLVLRLGAERDAVANKLQASEKALSTAKIDYDRQKKLFEEGLTSRRDYEQALIKVEDLRSNLETVTGELNQAEIALSRQNRQMIKAPRDGTVIQIDAGDFATFVSTGEPLASFFPDGVQAAAEIFINGLDAPLVYPGREVRLVFEGWPAVQFSGWPSVSIGTFKGEVAVVDPALSTNGRVRVLVTETKDEAWPSNAILRYGARTKGWIMLERVSLGYELWRQLNNFPPQFSEEARKSAEIQWGY